MVLYKLIKSLCFNVADEKSVEHKHREGKKKKKKRYSEI